MPAGAEAGRPVPGSAAGRREPAGAHSSAPLLLWHMPPPSPRAGCTRCALQTGALNDAHGTVLTWQACLTIQQLLLLAQELRIACALAEQELENGVSPRISPLAQVL